MSEPDFAVRMMIDGLSAKVAALTTRAEAAERENERLRAALWIIEKWDSFPRVRDPDRPNATMSYSVTYGSNGERDFMREVARAALSAARDDAEET